MVGFVANPARVLRLRWFNAIGCDDPSQARLGTFECKMYAIFFSTMEDMRQCKKDVGMNTGEKTFGVRSNA